MLFAILIVVFSLLTLWLSGLWMYNDCISRDIPPLKWVLLMVLTTPIFGFIIYYILKRRTSPVIIENTRNKFIAKATAISIILLICSSAGLVYFTQL